MKQAYYLDTSIWLDLFEDRDEPKLQKGTIARKLINRIISSNDIIIYSDLITSELIKIGYSFYEIRDYIKPFIKILVNIKVDGRSLGRAKDLALKRNIPKNDVMHALIARSQKAILVTRDNHFKKLLDIVKSKKPEDII